MTGETFPELLARHAAERPESPAMQEKRYGVWQQVTWADYHERVVDFANGLGSLGVDRGHVIAILGDNRPEWLIAELAAQSVGAAVVGIYPTSIGEELVHIISHSGVEVVVAEDQEQVDKLIELKSRLPGLRHVIYYDPHGLERYDQPYLRKFADIEQAGREWARHNSTWLEERRTTISPDDVAVICTTSGTTARPKLAQISHRNMLEMARRLNEVDPMNSKDRYVSFLPFAWMGEQMLAVACGMLFGFTISFPESAATQRTDLREIGPSILFSPPRIWESMLSQIQVRVGEADRVKRGVFGWSYRIGQRVAERRIAGRPVSVLLRLAHWLADVAALRPVRDQLGLARIRRCYTGGAPLGPDLFAFFHAIGVNLKQIYGQTEICGIAVVHRDNAVSPHTVGEPLPGTELTFTDDGEILLRSPAVFTGYLGNEEATEKALDAQGWLHTGDAGYIDDNDQLVVVDRASDVLRAHDGTQFSPAFVENKLKFSSFIEEAVVFGGQQADGSPRKELTAIVTVDPATVGPWAEKRQISYTTYRDLAANSEVCRLIETEISRANRDLPDSIRVRRFVLLHKQLDPDDDEITRTRKVRRPVIAKRYAAVIAALDDGLEFAQTTSTITYQDGTTRSENIRLRIVEVSDRAAEEFGRREIWRGVA